jgi:hypothetical protein
MEVLFFICDLPLAYFSMFCFLYFMFLCIQNNKRVSSIQKEQEKEWEEPEVQRRKQRGYNYGAPWTRKWLPPCFQ